MLHFRGLKTIRCLYLNKSDAILIQSYEMVNYRINLIKSTLAAITELV